MSLDRRSFLGTLAAGLAAAPAIGRAAAAAARARIDAVGVQLYSVRDAMGKDFEGTLAKLAAIGYKEVEFAGYFDHTPQDVKAILGRHGLASPSTHIDYATVRDKLAQTLDTCHAIGHTFIVMPYLDDATRAQPDIWQKVIDTLNKAGAEAKKAGVQIAYHNHNFEFYPVNGKLPFDVLLEQCDANLVKFEMDLCWISAAGKDPLTYFAKYPGRFPMVHVKDLKQIQKVQPGDANGIPISRVLPDLADVGDGVIDWKRIFAKSSQAGIKHYIVEHDQPPSPFEDLKKSYDYLHALNF